MFHALSIRCKYPTIETGRLIFPLNLAQSWTKRLTNYAQLCLRGEREERELDNFKKRRKGKEEEEEGEKDRPISRRLNVEDGSAIAVGPRPNPITASENFFLPSNVGKRFAWIAVAVFFRAANCHNSLPTS